METPQIMQAILMTQKVAMNNQIAAKMLKILHDCGMDETINQLILSSTELNLSYWCKDLADNSYFDTAAVFERDIEDAWYKGSYEWLQRACKGQQLTEQYYYDDDVKYWFDCPEDNTYYPVTEQIINCARLQLQEANKHG